MSRHNGIEREQMTGAGAYEFSPGSAVEINRACDAFWQRRGTVDPASRLRPFSARGLAPVQPTSVAPAADPAPAGAPSEPSSSESVADTPAVAVPPEPLTPEPAVDVEAPVQAVPAVVPEPPVAAEPAALTQEPTPDLPPDLPAAVAALKIALLDYAFAKALSSKRVRTPEAAVRAAETILGRMNLPQEILP